MILINSTVSLGDALRTFNIMIAFIKQSSEPIYIHWTNRDVGDLFPAERYGAKRLDELPLKSDQSIINISYHDYTQSRTAMQPGLDFSAAVSSYFGINLEIANRIENQLNEPINYSTDTDIPEYDFIIAPYVLNNASKNMTPEFWQTLIHELKARYNASICVIGKLKPPTDAELLKIENDIGRFKSADFVKYNFTPYLEGCDYFVNQSLPRVATLLRKVKKCFITVDTGPTHLMNIIKRPHIELYSWCIIAKNSKNQDYTNMRQETQVTIEKTMEVVEGMIK
jgi:hypothetical protein